ALRTAGLGERALRQGEFSIYGERLDRVDLLAGGHGEEHQAAIESAVGAAGLIARHLNYGAGAAFSFGAAFFGAGETLVAQEIEKRRLDGRILDANRPTIEQKLQGNHP